MTAGQVARAIRRQQRTQRIVAGDSYPQRLGRWAWRQRRAAGIGMAAVGAVGATALAVPLIAAAGIGLGVFGVARHPAVRRVARGIAREIQHNARRAGRWVYGSWLIWRRRRAARAPVDGELVDEPTATATAPEPDVIDGEIVPDPPANGQPALATTAPAASDTPPEPEKAAPFAPPHRQPRLITAGNSSSTNTEEKTMSHPFETATEALADVSFTPESGMHAEAAVDAIPSLLSATAGSIRAVLASIGEQLPQGADSLEHLHGIADALDGLETQAGEQISSWKQSANWVWQGQD